MPLKNRLVGHRGDMVSFPENSLLAIQSAIDFGLDYVEFDVQFTKDQKPIVIHDADFLRVAGVNKQVFSVTEREAKNVLLTLKAEYPYQHVPSLTEVIHLINQTPYVTCFLEIKVESIKQFGLSIVVEKIQETLEIAVFPVVIISFDKEVSNYLRESPDFETGWVLSEYNEQTKQQLEALNPDYVFCNVKRLSKDQPMLWAGPWKWVIYDIKEPATAKYLIECGAKLIETGDVAHMALT